MKSETTPKLTADRLHRKSFRKRYLPASAMERNVCAYPSWQLFCLGIFAKKRGVGVPWQREQSGLLSPAEIGGQRMRILWAPLLKSVAVNLYKSIPCP